LFANSIGQSDGVSLDVQTLIHRATSPGKGKESSKVEVFIEFEEEDKASAYVQPPKNWSSFVIIGYNPSAVFDKQFLNCDESSSLPFHFSSQKQHLLLQVFRI